MQLLPSSATLKKICRNPSENCQLACCSTSSSRRLGQRCITGESQMHRHACINASQTWTANCTLTSFPTGPGMPGIKIAANRMHSSRLPRPVRRAELAPPAAIEEVDQQPDPKPHKEAQPRHNRKPGHQQHAEE